MMRLARLWWVIIACLVLLLLGGVGCGTPSALENTMTVTGVVTDYETGVPVSSIEVKLYTYHPNPVLEYLPPTGHVIGSDITTEEGEYRIEVNADLFQRLKELDYNKLVVFVAPGIEGFKVIDLARGVVTVDLVSGAPAPSGTSQ
jgi:hypothetical protein